MIFLDLEVPKYESMRTQEHKVPSLIKTLRGKGTVENSNEYDFSDRLYLNFKVNEENFKKLLKVYARFQTMCLIPMFDSGLKHKIYDSFEEYRKNTIRALLQSIEDNDDNFEDELDKIDKEKPTEVYLDVMKNKENGYKINPNVVNCMMVFLENFAFNSISDSSNGYEVEMIIWVCNDVTFYNNNEKEFLEEYYSKFISKIPAFEEIDYKIDSLFYKDNISDNLIINFKNIFNEQDLYSPEKQMEKISQPTSLYINNKYISQVEVRATNNLRRIPLVGKTKGFMQHLGKGEIGVTIKLVFNQKNAIDEKVIRDLKSLALYQQEFLTTTDIDFFLLRAMDIKELNLVTSVIEEPSDDVDATIVTLLFTASGSSKLEMSDNAFNLMKRENNTVLLTLFNKYLDLILDTKTKYNIKDKTKLLSSENYQEKLEEFSKIIISKNDKEHYKDGQKSDGKISNHQYETGYIGDQKYTSLDYKISNLFQTYYQKDFQNYADKFDLGDEDVLDDFATTLEIENLPDVGISSLYGIKDVFIVDGIVKDSFFTDYVLTRIEKLVFKMLNTYAMSDNKEKRNDIINQIITLDNDTQDEFVQKIFVRFLAEFFDTSSMTDTKKMVILAVTNTFKIEVINNLVIICKSIIDNDTNELLSSKEDFTITDDNISFRNVIKKLLRDSIYNSFDIMKNVVMNKSFKDKCLTYIKGNFLGDSEDNASLDKSFEKAIEVESDKLLERLNNITDSLLEENNYLCNMVEMIFKLNILSARYHKDDIKFTKDEMFLFNRRAKTLLISNCIMSLLMADISYEKSIFGVIAFESAKNIIGPHIITYTAINSTIAEIAPILNKKMNGNVLDNLDKDILKKITFGELYICLKQAEDLYKFIFGNNLDNITKLSGTFTQISNNNLDFQKYLDISVFREFESPIDFIKLISKSLDLYKSLFTDYDKDFKHLEKIKETYSLENARENLKEFAPEEKIATVLSVFSSADRIADLTINKNEVGGTLPTTLMNTELLGEIKLLRGMRNATRLVTSQYERMIPNYEVLIVDEKAMEMAYSRGYDYADKIYSINNIISINIKKDDVSNIKYAIIKIANTSPQYTGFDTILESQSVFSNNREPTIVYSSKYTTNRMAFRVGMLIAVSLDTSNQFYDFTGRIDSVNLNSDVITIKCSNFSAELMGKTFDINNITAKGMMSFPTKIANWFRKANRSEEAIAVSKSDVKKLNGHLIPDDCTNGKTTGSNFTNNLGGACGILFTSLEKSIDSIKHLDCPYNDLLNGYKLNNLLNDNSSMTIMDSTFYGMIFSKTPESTSHRIIENVNAVEFDVSFYGASYIKVVEDKGLEGQRAVETGEGIVLLGHSSFVPNDINNLSNIGPFEDNFNVKMKLKNGRYRLDDAESHRVYDGAIVGYEYSYRRNGVTLYNVLNDLTYRNPATYWEVFESGFYGTLFLGRNNYMIARKNKTSNISREDVDTIVELLVYNFKGQQIDKEITNTELINNIKYLSELASIYDGNFSKDGSVLKTSKLKMNRNKGSIIKEKSELFKDYYSEEAPATDIILAMSGYNLISCNISTNENYFNSVEIRYKSGLKDKMDRLTDLINGKSNKVLLKTFENLDDSRLRTNFIDPTLTTDLHTSKQAFEYAQSVMFKELTNYYSGKIVILYSPNIKKFDEVVLIDSRNKITGTVVVKDFEHIFDVESGAITVITPGMRVKTSSMLTDIYLTGLVNKLTLELNKLHVKEPNLDDITKVNKSVRQELDDAFKNIFKHSTEMPIAFDLTGYNLIYDKKANDSSLKQIYNETQKHSEGNDNFEDKSVTEEIKFETDMESIITPRNISNLPFKIYPLIKSGKPLMPDEDIYNNSGDAFSFLQGLYIIMKSFGQTYLDPMYATAQLLGCMSEMFTNFDISKEGYLDRLINRFFSRFIENSNTTAKEAKEFLDKMLADDYSNLQILDEDKIKLDRNLFYDRQTIAFFNCKKLNQYEDERIRKIAKLLSQFTVVNLVELDSRVTDNGKEDGNVVSFENGNLTVINKLISYMNEYNKNIIRKKNKDMTEWTCVYQDRLIESPTISSEIQYDDYGAVLINCSSSLANTKITNIQKIQFDTDAPKSKKRYALYYQLEIERREGFYNKRRIPIYVLHNYYGSGEINREENSNDITFDYETRCNLLKDLLKKINKNTDYIISGDFNLIVKDRYGSNIEESNRLNEYFYINEYLDKFGLDNNGVVTIKNSYSTIGHKLYDNFITRSDTFKLFGKGDVFYYDGQLYKDEYNSKRISDHYPVYLLLKNKNTII